MRIQKALPIVATLFIGVFYSSYAMTSEMGSKDSVTYGIDMPAVGHVQPLSNAIAALTADSEPPNKTATKISGTITKVCQKKGCWLILADGNQFARVTFKDYKTFVPTDTGNSPGTVFGVLSEKVLSPETVKHYAADAGDSTESVVAARREYTIVAEAILIEAKS